MYVHLGSVSSFPRLPKRSVSPRIPKRLKPLAWRIPQALELPGDIISPSKHSISFHLDPSLSGKWAGRCPHFQKSKTSCRRACSQMVVSWRSWSVQAHCSSRPSPCLCGSINKTDSLGPWRRYNGALQTRRTGAPGALEMSAFGVVYILGEKGLFPFICFCALGFQSIAYLQTAPLFFCFLLGLQTRQS